MMADALLGSFCTSVTPVGVHIFSEHDTKKWGIHAPYESIYGASLHRGKAIVADVYGFPLTTGVQFGEKLNADYIQGGLESLPCPPMLVYFWCPSDVQFERCVQGEK